jgi:hypothetical protein
MIGWCQSTPSPTTTADIGLATDLLAVQLRQDRFTLAGAWSPPALTERATSQRYELPTDLISGRCSPS